MLAGTKTQAATGTFLISLLVFGLLYVQVGCFGGASLGERCSSSGDCAGGLQCLADICTRRCQEHAECGDGFLCDDGECNEVVSAIGDSCTRELDCGPRQTCRIDDLDTNGDGVLGATCQTELIGAVVGAECGVDQDCRSGSCNLGRCTQLCISDDDCPTVLTCTDIPRVAANLSAGMFRGCLQRAGVLEHELEITQSPVTVPLPVPGNARSVAITARSDDHSVLVGVFRLRAPSGSLLYEEPTTLEDFLANAVRYTPGFAESTLLFPNRPDLELTAGAYQLQVGTALLPGVKIDTIPEVTVAYKLGASTTLDIHVYFLDLTNHPCQGGIGALNLDAATAKTLSVFQTFVGGIGDILGQAGIVIGDVTYHDIDDEIAFDALVDDDLGELLSLSTTNTGVNLFFVRSIDPDGVQVLVGGTPGAPRSSGSRTAGVAVSMDTLCYRSWNELARIASHGIARQMGLFRNVEPDSGISDPIGDSSASDENLMFYSEFGGTELSNGQAEVLRLYPGLR